jgi:hypothetical protein
MRLRIEDPIRVEPGKDARATRRARGISFVSFASLVAMI